MSTHIETTESKIRSIISRELGVSDDEITSNASLVHDLNCDSIDQVEIVMSCEEEFGIEIPDEDVPDIETFQQLVAYVEKKRAA